MILPGISLNSMPGSIDAILPDGKILDLLNLSELCMFYTNVPLTSDSIYFNLIYF